MIMILQHKLLYTKMTHTLLNKNISYLILSILLFIFYSFFFLLNFKTQKCHLYKQYSRRKQTHIYIQALDKTLQASA
jgi:predicted PurR-regulated permease PerM